ncbi:MAG: hypothetical protein Ct9H300mP1_36670 [Planctomycetaceae bacterium]|nr:MAG: hypothetical protein Ct9H300mP1_36670 [Planctomycetaceae bacterium]
MQEALRRGRSLRWCRFRKSQARDHALPAGWAEHLDLWDPKPNVPDNVKSVFKPIDTKLPGVQFTENMPNPGEGQRKFTMIRSMSYTPIGLFNHTAAIYMMLTGYTADKVSPRVSSSHPPRRIPQLRLQHHQAASDDRSDAALRDDAASAAGEFGDRQGGHRRIPRPGLRPVLPLPVRRRHGYGPKKDRINVDDLKLRKGNAPGTPAASASLRDKINAGLGELDVAVQKFALNEYYEKA